MQDSEIVLGLHRHLSAYSVTAATASLGNLSIAGKVYEMAWRLRGSALSSAARVDAIGIEAKIAPYELRRVVLPILDQLGWIKINDAGDGSMVSVEDLIPPPTTLLSAADTVLTVVMITAEERAALELLRSTTRQPLEREAALQAAASHSDEAAVAALEHLKELGLVREVQADDGRSAVFNPNVWTSDDSVAAAALRSEDANVSREVGALLEEVAAAPGMPESAVTSTERRWIDFAVSQGLIQRTVVATSNGTERRFLFTPHLGRDPFGVPSGDPSGHVRQLVGSMIYAATYADYKLSNPAAFVSRLISDGEAGDASPIGTDYPMLETGGIVRVIPGSSTGRFRLQLLQADVAEEALKILRARDSSSTTATGIGGIRDQRSYTHVERARAQLATETGSTSADEARLVAALREVTGRRSF